MAAAIVQCRHLPPGGETVRQEMKFLIGQNVKLISIPGKEGERGQTMSNGAQIDPTPSKHHVSQNL